MIKVKDLTRSYGNFLAVDQVSFEIGQGEIVGLLGHNGAGKTTIMKMLTGYLEPTSGTIEIDGVAVGGQRCAIPGGIGYLPENCPVYPEMTVVDYLDYAAALHGVPEERRPGLIGAAIARTELTPMANRMIGALSRGYRQRVGVAQAILHEPHILILDEPTNGLDPTQIQHMRDLITSLARNATVIISTHILDSRLDELQADSKIILQTDAAPEKFETIINGFKGVRQFTTVAKRHNEPGYCYGITLDPADDRYHISAALAKMVQDGNSQLYALHPETRNLEAVFAEINTQVGG